MNQKAKKASWLVAMSLFMALLITLLYIIPPILVFLGQGELLTAFTFKHQWIILFSENKLLLFSIFSILIFLTDESIQQQDILYRNDLKEKSQLKKAIVWKRQILNIILFLWILGFIVALLLSPLLLLVGLS